MSFKLEDGRDSSVGITTRYGLDGPGSNPGLGEIVRTHPSFQAVKRTEPGVDHPSPPSRVEVKEGGLSLRPVTPSGWVISRITITVLRVHYSDWRPFRLRVASVNCVMLLISASSSNALLLLHCHRLLIPVYCFVKLSSRHEGAWRSK